MYALADCNTFYASCEKAFRPEWVDKPLVVLSNNDGCVIALCKHAKKLGIRMGLPYFQVKDLCKRHGVIAKSSNYELYGDMSARVMETLQELAPTVEIYSIDEAFLDLDGLSGIDLQRYARELRRTVSQNTGIPVSIGLGKTKKLAKAANRYAKRMTEDFSWVIDSEAEREKILRWMATEEVWGIGRRLSGHLYQMGIKSAWELASCDSRMIRQKFSVVVQRVVWELQGTRCYGLVEDKPKNEIICSRAFGKVVYSPWELEQAVAKYVARAAEKLRTQNGYTQQIRVYAEGSNRFKDNRPWFYEVMVGLKRPTANTGEMISACARGAWELYSRMAKIPDPMDKSSGFRKAGVMLTDITWAGEAQKELYAPMPSERSEKLMAVMDGLNQRFGNGTLFHAAQGVEPRWKMRRELKSPNYTTRLAEIPTVYLDKCGFHVLQFIAHLCDQS